VNPSVPAKSVAELLAYVKGGAKLSYGSPGTGNTLHLAAEMMKARTGIAMEHIPYRGAGPAITDLLGGQIQVMFVTPPLSLAHIQAGKLRPLATTAAHRLAILPDVPTMAEAGVANFIMDGGWYGLFAPARTPDEIVARLYQETAAALRTNDVKEKYAALGLNPIGTPPAEFKDFLATQVKLYGELVHTAKIEPQ
jgi:tripartite-type tricarboxylate transporter receptor subunit TctC